MKVDVRRAYINRACGLKLLIENIGVAVYCSLTAWGQTVLQASGSKRKRASVNL